MKDVFSLLIPKEHFYITPILIDLNLLIFLLMAISGIGFITFNSTDLLHWGANYAPYIKEGQWWRLLTSIFLHSGIMHLVFNMVGLLTVGIFVEPALGKNRFAFLYILCGICASITSALYHPIAVGVGASGAIFGMYGIFLSLLLTKFFPSDFKKAFLFSTLIFIGYNLLMGISRNIDNATHIGGLITGIIAGFILSPKLKSEQEENASI